MPFGIEPRACWASTIDRPTSSSRISASQCCPADPLAIGQHAAIAAITSAVREAVKFDIGVNAHKNDAEAALAVPVSAGASFVRITVLIGVVVGPERIVEGSASVALDIRHEYAAGIEIWADLYELTSWPLAPI